MPPGSFTPVQPVLLVPVDALAVAIPGEESRVAHHRHQLSREVHLRRRLAPGDQRFGLHEVLAVKLDAPAVRRHAELAPSLPAVRAAPDRAVVRREAVAGRFEFRREIFERGVVSREEREVGVSFPW